MRTLARQVLLVAGWCALHAAVAAEPPPPAPDAEFLEFLGNGDDADADLQQYLTKRERPVKSVEANVAPTRESEKP